MRMRIWGACLTAFCLTASVLAGTNLYDLESGRRGRLFVVAVGVGSYQQSKVFGKLPTDHDLEDLETTLSDARLTEDVWSEVRFYSLTGSEVTHKNLSGAFRKVAGEMVPGDGVLFYFNGHALPPDTSGEPRLALYNAQIDVDASVTATEASEKPSVRAARLPAYRFGLHTATGWSYVLDQGFLTSSELLDIFATLHQDSRLLVVLDNQAASRMVELLISGVSRDPRFHRMRMHFLSPGLESKERRDGRGVFTYSLLRTLETGLADYDKDGFIDTSELEGHLLTTVAGNPRGFGFGKSFPLTRATEVAVNRSPIARAIPLAPELQEALKPPGQYWALLVGVSKYDSSEINQLRFPDDDAVLLGRALSDKAVLGIPEDHIRIITEQGPLLPTSTEVQKGFNWLKAHAGPDDTVIVFFSGHGHDKPDEGLTYLLTQNSDPSVLLTSAISNQAFDQLLEGIKARTKLVFLDACHSGGVSKNAKGSHEMSKGQLERLHQLSEGEARFLSCRKNELSWEVPDPGYGVFTYHLEQGLRGAADLNNDGVVTLTELELQIKEAVSTWAAENGKQQSPTIWKNTAGEVIVSRPGQPAR